MTNLTSILKLFSALLFPLVLLASNCGDNKPSKPNVDPPVPDMDLVLNPDTCDKVDAGTFTYSAVSPSPFTVRFSWTKPPSATSFEAELLRGNAVVDTYTGPDPFFETTAVTKGTVYKVNLKTICGSLSNMIVVDKIVVK